MRAFFVRYQTVSALALAHRKYRIADCGAHGKLFRYFELAQLTGGGLGCSKPATNLMQAHQHAVWRFYYIQALLNCLL
jgi:hypothetical protein